SDWSTKLIRGLTSEAAAGFRSRLGLSYDDSAPVTPHNAPFPTYKAARVHMPIWGYGCGMVDCSVCAGVGDDAGDQRYHRELAANRSGASKTCRPGASECSIERRCD